MTKDIRLRFVAAAMLSLLILLIILVTGITAVNYVMMERSADRTLQMLSEAPRPTPPADNASGMPLFGYRVNPGAAGAFNHFTVITDQTQAVVSVALGNSEAISATDAQEYGAKVLERHDTQGKIGSYKYLMTALGNGSYRIVFLDISVQAQMLASTLRASSLVALLCMVLMLVIVMLISRRAIAPIARNMEKQRRFVTDAGHEIKTPLAIILANTDAMELHLGENKWSRNIRGQTLRLSGLMKQLLELSRMDECGAQGYSFEAVDFSDLVHSGVSAFTELAGEKQIATAIDAGVNVYGHRTSLEQLISILMDNALKYSDKGGTIAVRLEGTVRNTVLEVINTFQNLPAAEPETLFDRFYRADTARTQSSGGYGIGLSMAKRITSMHGGIIRAFYDDEHTIRFRAEFQRIEPTIAK